MKWYMHFTFSLLVLHGGHTQGDHLRLPLVQPQPCQNAVLDTEVGDILDLLGVSGYLGLRTSCEMV